MLAGRVMALERHGEREQRQFWSASVPFLLMRVALYCTFWCTFSYRARFPNT